MKIENTFYVIMRVGNIDCGEEYATKYMCDKDVDASEFTNDIARAMKSVNRSTALSLKYEYDLQKNHACESDLKIIPLKITYEW